MPLSWADMAKRRPHPGEFGRARLAFGHHRAGLGQMFVMSADAGQFWPVCLVDSDRARPKSARRRLFRVRSESAQLLELGPTSANVGVSTTRAPRAASLWTPPPPHCTRGAGRGGPGRRRQAGRLGRMESRGALARLHLGMSAGHAPGHEVGHERTSQFRGESFMSGCRRGGGAPRRRSCTARRPCGAEAGRNECKTSLRTRHSLHGSTAARQMALARML